MPPSKLRQIIDTDHFFVIPRVFPDSATYLVLSEVGLM
jgi:hypothetical protein